MGGSKSKQGYVTHQHTRSMCAVVATDAQFLRVGPTASLPEKASRVHTIPLPLTSVNRLNYRGTRGPQMPRGLSRVKGSWNPGPELSLWR